MAHTIGRAVSEDLEIAPGTTNFPIPSDHNLRFVILHFTEVSLSSGAELRVNLGYDTDVFSSASGDEVWTRPFDPRTAPIDISLTGSNPVLLKEYLIGERTPGSNPRRPNVSHADPFLHTSPHQDADYEDTFLCGPDLDWINVRAAPDDPVIRESANAVCMIIFAHSHGRLPAPTSCTGTLIGPDLILTAHHCFVEDDGIDWKSASVTFDYETADLDGRRPDPYNPRFYKVAAVVGRSRAERGSSEWALLQIHVPSGGLGITPRELRRTPVMDGEQVMAIHHPHGSPKKFQSGPVTISLRTRFDYAGGSSGSSLFDMAGQVIGGPLGHGSNCSPVYVSARTVLENLDSPRPPSSPLDVVLVLDRSGSMRQASPPMDRSKLQEAQSATAMFVRLVREEAGDRMGLVSYSTTATIEARIAEGTVTSDLKDALVGSEDMPGGSVGRLIAGGLTSIGDGLQKAVDTLNEAPPTGNERVILLMTDGLHNTDPAVNSVDLTSTKLGIAGFGHDHELDSAFLRTLAGNNDGAYTRTADGLGLRKLFALRFGNFFGAGALLDPEILLAKSEMHSPWEEFPICNEDHITLVIVWDDPRNDLDAILELPNGTTVDITHSDVQSAYGDTWWFLKTPCRANTQGLWRYRIRRVQRGGEFSPAPVELRVNSLVLPKGGPTLTASPQQEHLYTGDDLNLKVGLFNTDGTAPHGKVHISIEAPDGSLGTLAQNEGSQSPITSGDPVDGFRATLRQAIGVGIPPVPTRTHLAELFDDGNQLDGSFMRDGYFTNSLKEITLYEGTYTIHARAEYQCDELRGMREVTWSLHVAPGIDPATTGVQYFGDRPSPDGQREGFIRIHPHDQYNNPLGPGRSSQLDIAGTLGTRVNGAAKDNADGTYDVPISWTPTDIAKPGLAILQPGRDPIILGGSSPEGHGGKHPLVWLCCLLGITSLVLLIALLLTLY